MYGPTDLTSIKPVEKTVKGLKALPPMTPDIVKAALFSTPQTFTVSNPEAYLSAPRALLGLEFFRSGGIGEFLAAGLTPEFGLRKPGSLPVEVVAKICESKNVSSTDPAQRLTINQHPPFCLYPTTHHSSM